MENDFRIRDGTQSYNNYKWRKQPEHTLYGKMYQKMSIESEAEPSAGVHYKAQSGWWRGMWHKISARSKYTTHTCSIQSAKTRLGLRSWTPYCKIQN